MNQRSKNSLGLCVSVVEEHENGPLNYKDTKTSAWNAQSNPGVVQKHRFRAGAMPEEADDQEILARIKDGDIDAYSELVRRYQRYVMAILLRHMGHEGVEDVCHDVFVQAYESLRTYRGDAPFRFWLSSVAVRRCYAFWREQKRSLRQLPQSGLSPEAARWCERAAGEEAKTAFQSDQDSADAKEVVERLLAGLSAEDRLIIGLVHLEERPVKEVAALLGWSVSNVKIRAFRARKIMKTKLRDLLGEETV